MKKEVEERTSHRIAKVHKVLDMWQGSQNLRATQKESRAENQRITSIGYIWDSEEIIKALWSLFQHDGAAAFKLSGRSPLPPPLSAKDLPGGQTQIFNVRWLGRIDGDPVRSGEDCAPESISDTEDWLNRNRVLDSPNSSEDDCVADGDSDQEQVNSMEDEEFPKQWDVSAARNLPWIDLADTEVKETCSNGANNGQCNQNEKESGSEEKLGQKASMIQ